MSMWKDCQSTERRVLTNTEVNESLSNPNRFLVLLTYSDYYTALRYHRGISSPVLGALPGLCVTLQQN